MLGPIFIHRGLRLLINGNHCPSFWQLFISNIFFDWCSFLHKLNPIAVVPNSIVIYSDKMSSIDPYYFVKGALHMSSYLIRLYLNC